MHLCLTHFLTFIVAAVIVQLYKERTKPPGWIKCLHIWHKPSNNQNLPTKKCQNLSDSQES